MFRRLDIFPLAKPRWGKSEKLRYAVTRDFIARHSISPGEQLLDIGAPNEIGKNIARYFGCDYRHTVGDLDTLFWDIAPELVPGKVYDIVLCLEVIEHLLNPLFFLQMLKSKLGNKGRVFLSYPSQPHFLWSHFHFHEYDQRRFDYLLKTAGYRVISHNMPWAAMFLGIRPVFRFLLGGRRHLYCLELDK